MMNNIEGSATENASIALYRYMCQKIIGSEEHVKTIRTMNTDRDNLSSDENILTITSGSFGEGIEMRGSDLDIMKILKLMEVCEDKTNSFNSDKVHFAMETNDTQPGFTQLRLLNSKYHDIFQMCEEKGNEFYLSSTAIKHRMSISPSFPIVHGPCVTDMNDYFDVAVCLRSKSWITAVTQWITRSNCSWPRQDVKESIIQHGIIFVPIGVKGSINEDLEWRLSFSVGEKFLIYTFTHSQLLCYALMKILLKDIIDIDLECKDLLSLYFMKTILFWISEECSPTIWKPENLICNFMRCFKRLIYCVENSVCPHYFIPLNNLFENKIKGHTKEILLNKLRVINSYDWQCILFSHQFSNFRELEFDRLIEPISLDVEIFEKILSSNIMAVDSARPTNNSTIEKRIHMALPFQSSKIRYIYSYYMSRVCASSVHLLQLNDSCIFSNKSTYKQYRTCESTLLRTLRLDAVSGWLMLASFFYKTKQYNSALYINKYSLSQCTSEKIHPLMKLSNIHQELFDLHVFRNMSIVQLLKFMLV